MERDLSPSRREVRKSRREMVILFRRFMLRQAGRQELERLEQLFQTVIQRDTAAVAALVESNERLVAERCRGGELEARCQSAEARAFVAEQRVAELSECVREFEISEHSVRKKHDEREQALVTDLTQAIADQVTLQRRLDLAHEQAIQAAQQFVNVERAAAEREAAVRGEAALLVEAAVQQRIDAERIATVREAALQAEWLQRLVEVEGQARVEREQDARRIASLRQRLAAVEFRLVVVQHRLGWVWRTAMLARRVWHQARGRGDAWDAMQAAFQQLKEDTLLFVGPRGRMRLQPSEDLRPAGVSYPIALRRRNLCGVRLAVAVDEPHTTGSLSLEIVHRERVVARSMMSLAVVREGEPVRLGFPPVAAPADDPIEMRVAVHDAPVGVRVFELRRWSCGGLGRLVRRPFASYLFTEGAD
jgi:hypothetical protein